MFGFQAINTLAPSSTLPIETLPKEEKSSAPTAKFEVFVEYDGKVYHYTTKTSLKNIHQALSNDFYTSLNKAKSDTPSPGGMSDHLDFDKKMSKKSHKKLFQYKDYNIGPVSATGSSLDLLRDPKLNTPTKEQNNKGSQDGTNNYFSPRNFQQNLVKSKALSPNPSTDLGETQRTNKEEGETFHPMTGLCFDGSPPRKIFGVPLDSIFSSTTHLPPFLERAFEYLFLFGLRSVGLFRLSAATSEVLEFQNQLETGYKINKNNTQMDINIIASLVKKYFRELPVPLIPFNYYQQFLTMFNENTNNKSNEEDGKKIQISTNQKIRTILRGFPKVNYHTLQELIFLCLQVNLNNGINRMNASNLAIVIGPNILRPEEEKTFSMQENGVVQQVVKHMIDNYHDIFGRASKSHEYKNLEFICKWVGHQKSIISLTTNTNNDRLFSVDINGLIRVYNTTTLEFIEEIKTREDEAKNPVLAAECIRDTMWIGSMKSFQIWSTDDIICLFSTPRGCWALKRVGDLVWTCDGTDIIIYDSNTYEEVHKMAGCVTKFVHVNDTVWGALPNSKIIIWDQQTYEVISTLETNHKKINHMFLTNDNATLWICCNKHLITVWDVNKREMIHSIPEAHSDKIFCFTKFQNFVYSSSWEGDIKIWNATTYEAVEHISNEHSDSIEALAALQVRTQNNSLEWRIFSGSCDKTVCAWKPIQHISPTSASQPQT